MMNKLNFVGVTIAIAVILYAVALGFPEHAPLLGGVSFFLGLLFSFCIRNDWFGMGFPKPDNRGVSVNLDILNEDGRKETLVDGDAVEYLTNEVKRLTERCQFLEDGILKASHGGYHHGYCQGANDAAEDKCLPEQRAEEYMDWLLEKPTQH